MELNHRNFQYFIGSSKKANTEVAIAFLATYADENGNLPAFFRVEFVGKIEKAKEEIPAVTENNIMDGIRYLIKEGQLIEQSDFALLVPRPEICKTIKKAHEKI